MSSTDVRRKPSAVTPAAHPMNVQLEVVLFRHIGDKDRVPGPDPARRAKRSLASFSDLALLALAPSKRRRPTPTRI